MAELSYIKELREEKSKVDNTAKKVLALVEREIQKIESGATDSEEVYKFIDATKEKPIKLKERVLIPIKEFPKFNFVGKILGPKGNCLKRMQEDTGARMSVLGKGSVRSKEEEEKLLGTGDPKYGHLRHDLHVSIEVFAPPLEAYSRMSHALSVIKPYLIPDFNDDIRASQFEEMGMGNNHYRPPLSMGQNKKMKTAPNFDSTPKRYPPPAATNNFGYQGDIDYGYGDNYLGANMPYDNGNSYSQPRNDRYGGRLMGGNDYNHGNNDQFNSPHEKWSNKAPSMGFDGHSNMAGGRGGGYQRNRY